LHIALTSEGKSSPERRKGSVCTPNWTEKTRQQADTRLLHLKCRKSQTKHKIDQNKANNQKLQRLSLYIDISVRNKHFKYFENCHMFLSLPVNNTGVGVLRQVGEE